MFNNKTPREKLAMFALGTFILGNAVFLYLAFTANGKHPAIGTDQ